MSMKCPDQNKQMYKDRDVDQWLPRPGGGGQVGRECDGVMKKF